jgi:hypothetical protein
MVKHQVVSVGILEQRHVADARVDCLTIELHTFRLELCSRRRDIRDPERNVAVLRG